MGQCGLSLQSVVFVAPQPIGEADIEDEGISKYQDLLGERALEQLMFELARQGFRRVLLLCESLDEGLEEGLEARLETAIGDLPDQILEDCQVRRIDKGGVGRALWQVRDLLDEAFLVVEAFRPVAFNFLDLQAGPQNEAVARLALASVALCPASDTDGDKVVNLKGDLISGFGISGDGTQARLANAGVYWMRREILALLEVGSRSLKRDVFPLLATQGRLAGKVYQGFASGCEPARQSRDKAVSLPLLPARPAAFLDRDGVINLDHGYVHKAEDFQWTAEAVASIKALNDRGLLVFVVTNQSGVARGYYSEAEVKGLHDWMQQQLRPHGAHIDAFRYCPHHPVKGSGAYLVDCNWRKPGPGMLLDLMAIWPVDQARSFMVGDRQSDLDAADAAGLSRAHLTDRGLTLDLLSEEFI